MRLPRSKRFLKSLKKGQVLKLDCHVCSIEFDKTARDYKGAIKRNPKVQFTCSRSCQGLLERTREAEIFKLKCSNPKCKIVFIRQSFELSSQLRNNKNKYTYCSKDCHNTHKKLLSPKIKHICSNKSCKKTFHLTEQKTNKKQKEGSKNLYCSKSCYLTQKTFKKVNNICSVTGCNKLSVYALKCPSKTNPTKTRRLCNEHKDDLFTKIKNEELKLKKQYDQDCFEIFEGLGFTLDLTQINEKATRQSLHVILHLAGLNTDPRPKNERFFYIDKMTKSTLDIDMVYDEIELITEWKSHAQIYRRNKQAIYDQHKQQLDVIQTSPFSNYELVVASIDGSIGQYNTMTYLEFVRDRAIAYNKAGKLKKVNIKNTVLILNNFIDRLKDKQDKFKLPEIVV